MKKNIAFLIIFILILIASTVYFWFYQARYFIGRASVSRETLSIDNSYIFITPLKALADGEEQLRVTVFVLNSQGLGVLGKKVALTNDSSLKIKEIQNITDDSGKAVYDVSSVKPGDYYVDVRVNNTLLPQKAHLSYY